jgi:hypothetical protein
MTAGTRAMTRRERVTRHLLRDHGSTYVSGARTSLPELTAYHSGLHASRPADRIRHAADGEHEHEHGEDNRAMT